jgi:hypothetical protein
MSPFDIVKSLTQTKDDLYESEEIVDKDYVPFMVNRILSMSRQTALFVDAINQYGCIDKRLQYDFYRIGIPKSKAYSKWIKKDDSEINQEHIDHICDVMHVSMDRAIDLYKLMGSEAVRKDIEKRGGKK